MGRRWLVGLALLLTACGDDLPRCAQVATTLPIGPACSHEPCTDLFVVAHPDDDLLFMGSDLAGAIARNHRIIVIYVTAGELSGMDDQYWIDRERGVLNAFSALVDARAGTHTALPDYRDDSLPGDWSAAEPLALGGMIGATYELQTTPITAVFLRLGDYQEQCLWEQTNGCSTHNPHPPAPPYVAVTVACPGDASDGHLACATPAPVQDVGDDALVTALVAAIEHFRPTTLGTLDSTSLYFDSLGGAENTGYVEYPDHFYSALYALRAAFAAVASLDELPVITSYRGYTVTREPANLTDPVACQKDRAFDAYATFDTDVSFEHGKYALDDPQSWQRRSYASHSLSPRSGKLANQGKCLGMAAGAPGLLDCDTAPAWTLDAHGRLSTGTQCLRVIRNGGHVVRPLPVCSGAPCTPTPTEFPAEVVLAEPCDAPSEDTVFAIFDNGQIRSAYARCLATRSDQLFSADCEADLEDDHVTGQVPVAQAWTWVD